MFIINNFKGICSIKGNDVNVRGLQMSVNAAMEATSSMGDQFLFMGNSSKIVIVSLDKNKYLPNELFQYEGELIINNGIAIDSNMKQHNIAVTSKPKFKTISNTTFGNNFEDFKETWDRKPNIETKKILETKYITNNLTTKEDEFYFEDGTPYFGNYHMYGNGQAMTGLKHTDISEKIYRKKGEDIDLVLKLTPLTSKSKILSKKNGGY